MPVKKAPSTLPTLSHTLLHHDVPPDAQQVGAQLVRHVRHAQLRPSFRPAARQLLVGFRRLDQRPPCRVIGGQDVVTVDRCYQTLQKGVGR